VSDPSSALPSGPDPKLLFSLGSSHPSVQLSDEAWQASISALSAGQMGGVNSGSAVAAGSLAASSASAVPPRTTAYRGWTPQPSHGRTAAVRWLVYLPLIYTALQCGVVVALMLPMMPGVPNTSAGMTLVLANLGMLLLSFTLLGLGYLAATIWLAVLDRRALERLGHTQTASPWWNLLGTLWYLIFRLVNVRRITGGGAAPLVMYCCLYILPGVALGLIAAYFRGTGTA
jgi:hypothetical protein